MTFGIIRSLVNWLTVEDYENDKRDAEREVVARYSRGNVAIQNGHFLDENDLEQLRRSSDRAYTKIMKRAARL